jgi:hypothetical protein
MRVLWGAIAVALVACGGGRETPTEGRGTAACRIWQDSVCDWADRCEALTRDDCDEQFQGVVCRSDDMANKCTREFDGASCQTVPPRCGLDEVADPTPATKACAALTSLICKRSVKCGVATSESECLAAEPIDCSLSVAIKLDYETCIDRVEKLDCDVLVLPDICQSVIISKDPSQQD